MSRLFKGGRLGLFDIFKKKHQLLPEDESFCLQLKSFHAKMQEHLACHKAWESIDLHGNDIMLSFVGFDDQDDVAITLSPKALPLVRQQGRNDILIDVSKNGDTPWEEIKNALQSAGPFEFFGQIILPSACFSDTDDKNKIPRIISHPANLTGFWMWLPLPLEVNFVTSVENFDALFAWCRSSISRFLKSR